MLALNDEYEKIFLNPLGIKKEDYIGKRDAEIWPDEFASKFKAVDYTVQRTGGVWVGMEWVIVNDSAQRWQVIKYPAKVGRSVVGVGGFAIPPKNSIYFPMLAAGSVALPVEPSSKPKIE